ncbi:MAG: hypothetical protein JWN86_2127 [Planctomycetota bacterium]|nr:hypothetical protein [Planctomycetota bacterium]
MAQFYTLEEAARVLGMSADELKHKAQQREVRAFLDGGSWRFRVADVDELARRRGMGSDPDLSLSDLDLEIPPGSGSGDIDLSEFQLGVAKPDFGRSGTMKVSDDDVLLDDMSLPPATGASSSSTIIGMKSAGKQPSDSDVRLVPDGAAAKGASDSDVRLASPPPKNKYPSDSDVTLVSDSQGSSEEVDALDDPGATTLRKSPMLGSSAEVDLGTGSDDSDFELTPSSVIDALQPDSGSDFELTALDASDEFEATPLVRSPSDSDVTGAEPASSGINLGRPSDSGINLSGVGGFDFGSAESIELAPLDEDIPKDNRKKPAAPPKPTAKGKAPKADASSETSLPIKGSAMDPSATSLPIKKKKGEKDIFEDTDFEVDALDSGQDDRTVQLEAASDFDLDEGESASEVFALDEDEIDENAATAMGPASLADDDEYGDDGDEVSGETDSAWGDVESDDAPATPSQAAVRASASPAVATRSGPEVEWGGAWVSVLGVAAFLMLLMAFVSMDMVANLYDQRGSTTPIGYGLIKWLSGMAPWG